ncbi:DUF4124 domain-containing protein [Shewanella sp. VB17]|uniref:DUF4124 domain-containing protein n=1 Tax=Shewanella sp. VB17 TaxID=2739432 RepID=UPI00156529AD|nr:DUF4124 domain-containing protein [Shewanella sp. VB17]NRD72440.1 DUF4124 domain-containing protein [Shewanella sp. VB17]
MAKVIVVIISLFIMHSAQANIIYKCVKGSKTVFSQNPCKKDYSQRKIEFELGITTEIDSDKTVTKADPIQQLLTGNSFSLEKKLELLDTEIYRLHQENSYFEILTANELQKVRRKYYWQHKGTQDPEYLADIARIEAHFNEMKASNNQIITLLQTHKAQIEQKNETEAQ